MVLKAISQYPSRAYAGLVEGIADAMDVETYINNAAIVAGVYDLVFTAVNNAVYTYTIYGIPLTHTADGTATVAEQRDAALAKIAAVPALVPLITAAASGNNVRITELLPDTQGPAGITGLDANTALTVVTAHSQTEPMPAGIVIARGPNFQDGRLVRASGDPFVGVTMHQHAPIRTNFNAPLDASANLYFPNRSIPVLKRGKIWCVTEEAVALTDTPFVRYAVGAGGSQLGAIRKSADTASAASLTGKAAFKTAQATAGGLVLLQINLVP